MVEINNLTKVELPQKFLAMSLPQILRQLKIKKNLSLVFVGYKKIKELNRKYLRKNKITDVLSFSGQGDYFGEIVVCLSRAKQQSRQQNHSFQKELMILLIHGILHLLGFNHQSKKERVKMEKMTEQLVKKIKIVKL